MGLYIRGFKIGYNYLEIDREKDSWTVIEKTFMDLRMLGKEKKLSTFTKVKTNRKLEMKELLFEMVTEDQKIKMEGRVEGRKLSLRIKSGDYETEKIFEIKKNLILAPLLEASLILGVKKEGEVLFFDPSTLTFDKGFLTYEGDERISHGGKEKEAKRYRLDYLGTSMRLWVAEGKILREESPMDLIAVEEKEEEATAFLEEKVDLLSLFAIKPKGDPGNPEKVKLLRLKLKGPISPRINLSFSTQRVIRKRKNYVILENQRPKLPKFIQENSIPDTLRKYLISTPFLQVEDKEIRELSLSIVKGERNQVEKVRKIMNWVYENIEKKPSVTLPSAKEVLRERYGDCNEHAVLFAALCRAAGIPCIIASGLVYEGGVYYYHAWDAVYLGGKWYFVDPIFGEFPASPHHLLLKLGEIQKQAELLSIVGKLEIEVVEKVEE